MWTAHAPTRARDWAIFAGADGRAQVRDCKDVGDGLPACVIKQQPKGIEQPLARRELIWGCTGEFPYTRRPPTFP